MTTNLFSPIRVGGLDLKHRIAMAPMTRNRADDHHVPLDIAREYYAQRASTPGTLLINEGTFISARAGGMENVPGIWNDEQIKQWRTVTDAVHSQGSFIFCQLWALGRAAGPEVLAKDGYSVISSGNLPISESTAVPKPLTEDEIREWISDYAQAAKNAIAAGFDGVEIHGANGYLCDQFLQSTCNNREDSWGGSVENRSRFGLEVAKAVANAVGPERTGYRISPWSRFQGMRMDGLHTQFTHLVEGLGRLNLAYLHVVEPRISGGMTVEAADEDNSFLLNAFGDKGAIILAGGFTGESAEKAIQAHPGHRVAIAFGRHFLANPDLPFRIAKGLDFNQYERPTFYTPKSPVGYIDYPFSKEYSISV
ncbi:NADPH dehydrogenase [Aspergillus steynii IBT 23096]|uniref:NADPH dehydrogenase n=1 Tax=Aspergillus steynii IBT 23096 TaxID=1392250 RepID=A0A2I2GB45_9EURO|nr:NADPH dehydrogenase [Aspergillus steynii IBT 23096]PLB50101.1 NADPH dehydrogenase [Aspergillus steynii IBT 23096]